MKRRPMKPPSTLATSAALAMIAIPVDKTEVYFSGTLPAIYPAKVCRPRNIVERCFST